MKAGEIARKRTRMGMKICHMTCALLSVALATAALTGCRTHSQSDESWITFNSDLELTKTLPISEGMLSESNLQDNSFKMVKNGKEGRNMGVYGTLLEMIDVDGNVLISLGSEANNSYKYYDTYHDEGSLLGEGYDLDEGYKYLGQGYYRLVKENGEAAIVKNGKEIYQYQSTSGKEIYQYQSTEDTYQKDNIIYYGFQDDTGNKHYTIAYDLENNKQLWRIDNVHSPVIFGDYFIRVTQNENGYAILNINNGEIISAGTARKRVLPSISGYYLEEDAKTEENRTVRVYDKNKNEISSLALAENDSIEAMLSNGMYICRSQNQYKRYKIYDINSQFITDLAYLQGESIGSKDYTVIASNYSVHCPEADIIIYGDQTIELVGSSTGTVTDISGRESVFITACFDKNKISPTRGAFSKIINLETKAELRIDEREYPSKIRGVSSSHIIVRSTNNQSPSRLYDAYFNVVYSTENEIRFIDNEYLIEYNEQDKTKMYIVRISSLEKKAVNVQGDYSSHNGTGLITKDDMNYYLYKFNL